MDYKVRHFQRILSVIEDNRADKPKDDNISESLAPPDVSRLENAGNEDNAEEVVAFDDHILKIILLFESPLFVILEVLN